MTRTFKNRGGRDGPGQLLINWADAVADKPAATAVAASTPEPDHSTNAIADSPDEPPPLVQRLPWDFKNTFPQPMPEAIDAGAISDEDSQPESVRAIHEEHARELLMTLHDLDAVLDARRNCVDPKTGRKPTTAASQERLEKLFATEPDRLRRWWRTMMDTYESAFGHEAADAFGKAVRAWHAGVEVTDQPAPTAPLATAAPVQSTPADENAPGQVARRRIVARLPVPRPLPSAVAAGQFGREEDGNPVCPGAHEVRLITEQHAEKLLDILDSIQHGSGSCVPGGISRRQDMFDSGIAAYAEDFGQPAADQLEAYVRRQASLDERDRSLQR